MCGAEVVYILASPALYRTPRTDLATALTTVLSNPGLQLDHKGEILRVLDRYGETNLGFADCLCIEHIRRLELDGISSYDRDFDRILGLRRLEP